MFKSFGDGLITLRSVEASHFADFHVRAAKFFMRAAAILPPFGASFERLEAVNNQKTPSNAMFMLTNVCNVWMVIGESRNGLGSGSNGFFFERKPTRSAWSVDRMSRTCWPTNRWTNVHSVDLSSHKSNLKASKKPLYMLGYIFIPRISGLEVSLPLWSLSFSPRQNLPSQNSHFTTLIIHL